MIPYGRQDVDDADIAAVVEVLRSDWLTQGPTVELFENSVSQYCRARHAVAASSATAALHLAYLALGLGKGDILWTSPNTFVATANAALYCGAQVDFVDIDPRTYNLSPEALEEKLKGAARENRLPKIVVPVHFAGQSCDMESIFKLSQDYGFQLVEDASHAIGGEYQGEQIGSCKYSAITVFSFHPVKIITTGEGGMAVTNTPALANRMRLLRSHGITRSPSEMTGESEGPWYYQQIALGLNYRMTDIHAALGASQLRRIDEFIARRRYLAARYDELMAGLPLQVPEQHEAGRSAWHLYAVQLLLERLKKSRREIFEDLRHAGIGVHVHYIPVHRQPYYRESGWQEGSYPQAEKFYRRALSLPLFPGLKDADQEKVVANLQEILE